MVTCFNLDKYICENNFSYLQVFPNQACADTVRTCTARNCDVLQNFCHENMDKEHFLSHGSDKKNV